MAQLQNWHRSESLYIELTNRSYRALISVMNASFVDGIPSSRNCRWRLRPRKSNGSGNQTDFIWTVFLAVDFSGGICDGSLVALEFFEGFFVGFLVLLDFLEDFFDGLFFIPPVSLIITLVPFPTLRKTLSSLVCKMRSEIEMGHNNRLMKHKNNSLIFHFIFVFLTTDINKSY